MTPTWITLEAMGMNEVTVTGVWIDPDNKNTRVMLSDGSHLIGVVRAELTVEVGYIPTVTITAQILDDDKDKAAG